MTLIRMAVSEVTIKEWFLEKGLEFPGHTLSWFYCYIWTALTNWENMVQTTHKFWKALHLIFLKSFCLYIPYYLFSVYPLPFNVYQSSNHMQLMMFLNLVFSSWELVWGDSLDSSVALGHICWDWQVSLLLLSFWFLWIIDTFQKCH